MRVAVAGQGLVDGVVDDLVDEVVQAARAGRADVHAGPLADRLQALEKAWVMSDSSVLLFAHGTSPDRMHGSRRPCGLVERTCLKPCESYPVFSLDPKLRPGRKMPQNAGFSR